MSITAPDYTLSDDCVSVFTYDENGVPSATSIHSSHPTFKSLVRALKRKEWERVPRLLSAAKAVESSDTSGNVEVRDGVVYYKGTPIDNTLTSRILDIISQGKSAKPMIRFMDNLYSNPASFAISELYDWLRGSNLPITDDGCFMAYKRVNSDFKDCYTNTIDNSPGQIVTMARSDVDPNRNETCSRGLHFCSVSYLQYYPGSKILKVKINPKDVVSIPTDYNYAKGRTWKYEVIGELNEEDMNNIKSQQDINEFQTSVYPIAKERKVLLADTLALPAVKRLIKKRKMSQENIRKMSYGRLVSFYKRFNPQPDVLKAEAEAKANNLKSVRESYGLTRGEVAEKMGATYRDVFNAENAIEISQDTIDKFLKAIINLAKLGLPHATAVGYPKVTVPGFGEASLVGVGVLVDTDEYDDEYDDDTDNTDDDEYRD